MESPELKYVRPQNGPFNMDHLTVTVRDDYTPTVRGGQEIYYSVFEA